MTILNIFATGIGWGMGNTTSIVNNCGFNTSGIAAKLCYDLVLNGYDDWFLPSKDELNQLFLQQSVVGGFAPSDYWSSSEYAYYTAWSQHFYVYFGYQQNNVKMSVYHVRAVRTF